MKSSRSYAVVLVTAPDAATAQGLARAALEARLAACVTVVPGVESLYWWQGRIDSSAEVLLILKTTRARLPALEKLILARHPYDTPEFLALAPMGGSAAYLRWLEASVRPAGRA